MSEAIYWMLIGAGIVAIIIVVYEMIADDVRERVMEDLEKGGKKI